jgi:8-oxo-dGTP pyrophosphatase MutT (NUDIX family)
MTDRQGLIAKLELYHPIDQAEVLFKDQFLQLLSQARCFYRDHLPGHITGSAFIVDENCSHTLLTHHAKLNRWLQPGGHADGDEDIVSVALKEAREETGLSTFKVLQPESIFDIDIHSIPERNGFQEHYHFDVRILLLASREDKLVISHESHGLQWIPLSLLREKTGANESIMRMASKAEKLFRSDKQ